VRVDLAGAKWEVDGLQLDAVVGTHLIVYLNLNHIAGKEHSLGYGLADVLDEFQFFDPSLQRAPILADYLHYQSGSWINLLTVLQVLYVFFIQFDLTDARLQVFLRVELDKVGSPDFKLNVENFQKNIVFW